MDEILTLDDFFEGNILCQRERQKDREEKRNRGVLPDKSLFKDDNSISELNKQKQTEHKYDSGEFDPGSG